MKRLFILFILLTTAVIVRAQNSKVTGTVLGTESGKPISGATIQIGDLQSKTDTNGNFELNGIPLGKANITISIDGYESQTSNIDVSGSETKLGAFRMKAVDFYNSSVNGISEINLLSLDFDDNAKDQNIAGLLHSSNDVFVSTASNALSAGYFRIRGYETENALVYMDGIRTNDAQTGRPSWSDWGGLSDVTNKTEVANGLSLSGFSFGAVGGTTDILTRASLFGKQDKLSYSYSDVSYTHRLSYTYATGMMKNNWAFAFSGSRRESQEGYAAGTFFDGWSYFGAAEKKLNEKNSLALTIVGSPAKRGMQAAATEECYDLAGTHYYNPDWGYQDGAKRNARVKNIHEPLALLNHYLEINKKTKLTNALGFSFGRNSNTALNWYNAPVPNPDYYKYLPSWQTNQDLTTAPDQNIVNTITNAWKSDTAGQINWNNLYKANALDNAVGAQASYMVEERRIDHKQLSLSSNLNYQYNDHIDITAGIELSSYYAHCYQVVNDLLGGNYWVDIDQYAQQDFPGNPTIIQNDLRNPNKVIHQGDVFGYDYDIYKNTGLLWGQADFTYNNLEYFVAANANYDEFWRNGNMQNGRAPDSSLGKSPMESFLNYGVKAGATYKITGHNYIVGNIGYLTNPPSISTSFIDPEIKNIITPNLRNSTTLSGDISYVYKASKFNARLTAYETISQHLTDEMSYFDDDVDSYVNLTETGINKTYQGFELGAEYKINSNFSAVAVGNLGNYRYTSEPIAHKSVENGSSPDTTTTIYQKNFYVSGTPQDAGSIGIKYSNQHKWHVNANFNYFDKMYLDFDPERRTTGAVSGLMPTDSLFKAITQQQKLKGGYTIDLSVGKSFRVKSYFISINFSVKNILNNQDLIVNGYEQMRYDFEGHNLNKFPPKYFYGLGRTFFLTASIRI